MPNVETSDRLAYSSAEVAQALGITIQTVQEWLNAERIPGFQVGQRWFVRAEDFQALLRGDFGRSR